MASGDALPIPRKNVAYRITFPILDADGDLVSGATALDSEVSKDGGTYTDCTNEATEIAANSGMYFLDLTAAEMNADTVAIIIKTSASGAKTTPIVLYPEETGDIRVQVTQMATNVLNAAAINADAITAAKVAPGAIAKGDQLTGLNDLSAAQVNVEADTALSDYDAPTKVEMDDAHALLATVAALAIVDTVVDAIKAVTDLLPNSGALSDLTTILTDTNELQGDWVNGGRLDLLIDAIKAVTDLLPNAGALSDLATILVDTAELQGDWTNTGRLDTILDAIKVVTDNLPNAGALTNLDAAISSRSSHGDPDPSGFIDIAISSRSSHGDPTGNAMALTAAAINAIWDELTAEARAADSYGQLIKDNIDAPISGATAPDENVIADAVLSRPISNVEPAAFRTLYGAIASLVNRSRINALNQLEIYKVDDTTILVTIPGTVDSALLPIRELNPP